MVGTKKMEQRKDSEDGALQSEVGLDGPDAGVGLIVENVRAIYPACAGTIVTSGLWKSAILPPTRTLPHFSGLRMSRWICATGEVR